MRSRVISLTSLEERLQAGKCQPSFDFGFVVIISSLIALMLGRLEMDVQPCIDAYLKICGDVFSEEHLPVSWWGNIKGRFDKSKLEHCIKAIIEEQVSDGNALFNDGQDRKCRTYINQALSSWNWMVMLTVTGSSVPYTSKIQNI